MLCKRSKKPQSASLVSYEIEPMLLDYLTSTLAEAEAQCEGTRIAASSEIRNEDFILSYSDDYQAAAFRGQKATKNEFTHVIINPPYKKINKVRNLPMCELPRAKAAIFTLTQVRRNAQQQI